MTPGLIVLIDWRDALAGSREPNKIRPAIIVGCQRLYGSILPFEMVVPLTSIAELAIAGVSLKILPSIENGCVRTCYALGWNAQVVPHARITATQSRIEEKQLAMIRAQIASCVER